MDKLDGYKTYLGIFFTGLGIAAKAFGWHIDWLLAPEAQADIMTIFGLGLATYGRAVAKPKV
jgi:hypothetical protein